MSRAEELLIRKSIPPSSFVKLTRIYKLWCSVTKCLMCNTVGKYEDQHPVNPCPTCGASSNAIKEVIGRWVDLSHWSFIPPFYHSKGYWEIKK